MIGIGYRGDIGGKKGKTMVLPGFCKISAACVIGVLSGSGGAPGVYLLNWSKYDEEFFKNPRVTVQPKNICQNQPAESLFTIYSTIRTLIKCSLRRISFLNLFFA